MRQRAVTKLLLADHTVDPNSGDTVGRTPLSFAAKYGHDAIVMTFLNNECVDPDPKDHYGSTPLSIAARNCRIEVVKKLLATRRIDFYSQDCGLEGEGTLVLHKSCLKREAYQRVRARHPWRHV